MTNQDIKDTGLLIKNEQQIGGNTALRVGGVIEGIGYALDNKDAANGYYQATINGGSISVNAPNYLLGTGGNLRLKMPAAGTTASTLTIGNASQVPLLYNGAAVTPINGWDAGEIIDVFYDGQNFLASNSEGGGDVKVEDNTTGADLDINDDRNNTLARFSDGHVKTKNFDSRDLKTFVDDNEISDLDLSDEEGHTIARFYNGNVKTKNFDSAKINIETGNKDVVDMSLDDENDYSIVQFTNGHIKTKRFDSSKLFKEKPLTGYELFYVDVDTYYNYYEGNSTSVEDSEDIKKDLGLIQFSNLYSSLNPSRLVLWAHGTGNGLHTNSQSLTTDCDLSKALLKAGYSIFQVNGTPGEYGTDAGKHNISPIWYRSVLAAYKYLTDKYNFKRDGIFTFGMSLGSHASIQLNNYGTLPILAQVCFAGDLDIWKGSYGYYNTTTERGNILDKFGMTENRPTLTTQNPPSAAEQQYILDNIDKWLPYNPLTSGITNIDDIKTLYSVWLSSSTLYSDSEYELYKDKRIVNKPPLMLIYGENDTTNPPRWGLYYYRMVKNGGGYVKLRRYTGATHSTIFSAGVTTQTLINGETVSMCGSNYEAFLFLKRFDK